MLKEARNRVSLAPRMSRGREAIPGDGVATEPKSEAAVRRRVANAAMLVLSPRWVAGVLLGIALGLTTLSVIGQVVKHRGGAEWAHSAIQAFDLDHEDNVPSWYQAGLLLVGSLLAAVVAAHARQGHHRHVRRWTGLSIIFAWLSLDEAAGIHEVVNRHLHDVGHFDDAFFFAWVIPASALVAVVGFCYLRFFIELPPATRRLMLLAGVWYVGGALGMEMLGGVFATAYGIGHPGYVCLTTIEETLEMLGLVTFIYALLRRLASDAVILGFSEPPESP